MAQMTVADVATHGFLVDGKWIEDGDVVEVKSPLRRRGHRPRVPGTAPACRSGHRRRGKSIRNDAPPACLRAAAGSAPRGGRDCATQGRIRAHSVPGSGQADQGGAHRSRARIFTFTVAAEESTRIYGEYLPLDWQEFTAGRWGIVRRFPLGPIAGITPFNFPLNLVAHKVAPAIAAGCPMVLKPAPQTPSVRSLLWRKSCSRQAGPMAALNVLPLSNEDA